MVKRFGQKLFEKHEKIKHVPGDPDAIRLLTSGSTPPGRLDKTFCAAARRTVLERSKLLAHSGAAAHVRCHILALAGGL